MINVRGLLAVINNYYSNKTLHNLLIVLYIYFAMEITILVFVIKTHNSESQGQEAAIICKTKNMQPLSELFTCNNTQKLDNALARSFYKCHKWR